MNKMLVRMVVAAALVGLPALSQAQIVVRIGPPPPQAETQTPMTAPGMVWVPGHWMWNGAQHVWNPGHWDNPPQMGARWVPARWVRRGPQWLFMPGRWRGERGWIPAAPNVGFPPGVPLVQPTQIAQPMPMAPPGYQQVPMAPPGYQPGMPVGQPMPQGPVVVGQPAYYGRRERVMVGQPVQPVVVGQPMQQPIMVGQPMQQGPVVVGQPVQQGPVIVNPQPGQRVIITR